MIGQDGSVVRCSDCNRTVPSGVAQLVKSNRGFGREYRCQPCGARVPGLAVCTRAGRPRGARKSAPTTSEVPMLVGFGRCPNCRCSGVNRQPGWAEVAVRGWTLGIYRGQSA